MTTDIGSQPPVVEVRVSTGDGALEIELPGGPWRIVEPHDQQLIELLERAVQRKATPEALRFIGAHAQAIVDDAWKAGTRFPDGAA